MPFVGRDITDGDELLLVSVLKEGSDVEDRNTWERLADKARQLHGSAGLTSNQWRGYYLLNEERIKTLVNMSPRRGVKRDGAGVNVSGPTTDTPAATAPTVDDIQEFEFPDLDFNNNIQVESPTSASKVLDSATIESRLGSFADHSNVPNVDQSSLSKKRHHSSSSRMSEANKRRKQRVEFRPSEDRLIAKFLSRFPKSERDTSSHFKTLCAENPTIRQLPDSCRRYYLRPNNRIRLDDLADKYQKEGFGEGYGVVGTGHDGSSATATGPSDSNTTTNINNISDNINDSTNNNANNTNTNTNGRRIDNNRNRNNTRNRQSNNNFATAVSHAPFTSQLTSQTSPYHHPHQSPNRNPTTDIVVQDQLSAAVDPALSNASQFVIDDPGSYTEDQHRDNMFIHSSLSQTTTPSSPLASNDVNKNRNNANDNNGGDNNDNNTKNNNDDSIDHNGVRHGSPKWTINVMGTSSEDKRKILDDICDKYKLQFDQANLLWYACSGEPSVCDKVASCEGVVQNGILVGVPNEGNAIRRKIWTEDEDNIVRSTNQDAKKLIDKRKGKQFSKHREKFLRAEKAINDIIYPNNRWPNSSFLN